jgi:hypothetical protein
VTYAAPGAPPAGLAKVPSGLISDLTRLSSRIVTLCWVELRKIRHDRTELYTRAIQPALWLLIYGEVFTRVHAIPTPAGIPYLAYLAPGIMAQSALFIANLLRHPDHLGTRRGRADQAHGHADTPLGPDNRESIRVRRSLASPGRNDRHHRGAPGGVPDR